MTPNRKAFTLVELLVVISIIALLIGILIPALGKARKVAKGLECMVRVRAIGTASEMYIQDNKGYYLRHRNGGGSFPSVTPPVFSASTNVPWDHILYVNGYYGSRPAVPTDGSWPTNSKVWQTHNTCPEIGYRTINRILSPASLVYESYGWNAVTFLYSASDTKPNTKASRLTNPGRILLAGDAFRPVYDTGSSAIYYRDAADLPGGNGSGYSSINGTLVSSPANRHLGNSNLVFCDGHAAPHKYIYESLNSTASFHDISPTVDISLHNANLAVMTPTIP